MDKEGFPDTLLDPCLGVVWHRCRENKIFSKQKEQLRTGPDLTAEREKNAGGMRGASTALAFFFGDGFLHGDDVSRSGVLALGLEYETCSPFFLTPVGVPLPSHPTVSDFTETNQSGLRASVESHAR